MCLLMECMIFEIHLWRDSFHLFYQNLSLIILVSINVNLPDWKILPIKEHQSKKSVRYWIASKAQQEYGFLGNYQYRTFLRLKILIVDQQTVNFTTTVSLTIKLANKFCWGCVCTILITRKKDNKKFRIMIKNMRVEQLIILWIKILVWKSWWDSKIL